MAATVAFGLAVTGGAQPASRETGSPDAQQCRARGGTVSRRGITQSPVCVVPYADAGRACSDDSDCLGRCLLPADDDWHRHPPGSRATGQCQAENNDYGCFAEVRNGRVAGAFICTD